MSTPVATSSDLETFLGLASGSIDTARATLLLQYAHDLCETIVSPVPSAAAVVEVSIAARAYSNPTSAHQTSLGSASVSYGSGSAAFGIGGLYLSKKDKAALRRLAGYGLAFQADTLPSGTNAVQTVTVSATAGTFTLTFGGATTSALAYNATAAQVQSALEALSTIGSGNVAVTGSYVVTFQGTLGTAPLETMTADGSSLTGTVSVATTTTGAYAPAQNLPPWDYDYYSSTVLGSQIYGGY